MALDRDLSQCGWPPKVASSAPQVSVAGHVFLLKASVCVVVSGWVCMSACVCVSVYVFVYVSVHLWGGRVGFF